MGVWLRSPCATWPVAFSSPQARTSRYVCRVPGIPGLIDQDLQAVQLGNDTLTFSVRVIRACIAAQVPCFLENPQSTLSAPPSCDFASGCCLEFVSDVCQYGAAWRKSRKDCGWWSLSEAPYPHCAGKKLRSRFGRPGRSPQGLCWTEIAEAYPVIIMGPSVGTSYDRLRPQRPSSSACHSVWFHLGVLFVGLVGLPFQYVIPTDIGISFETTVSRKS